jgi:saccharopine dehydrogenase-like NADP-dependent oxidoreductase
MNPAAWDWLTPEFEIFRSDGLRSLLRLPIDNMVEYTLRRRGHYHDLTQKGIDVLDKIPTGDDLVILETVIYCWEGGYFTTRLKIPGTEEQSAMSRTTGLPCAIVARAILEGVYTREGVWPAEYVGMDSVAYQWVRDELAEEGIEW